MTTRFRIVCSFTLALVACSGSPSSENAGSGGSSSATGGASTSLGGQIASGGMATSSGGQPASGGQAAGGQLGTGGRVGSGGAPASGGKSGGSQSGGSSAGGSAASGGASVGGTSGSGAGGASAGTTSVAGGPSAGCGKAGAGTGVQMKQITVGAQARTYVLFVPTGYSAATPMPLIFAWHGLGGTGTLARQYFRIEQAAANKAIFVYPDALPLANQDNQTGWDLSANGTDFAFFDALLTEVTGALCVDGNRVFSAGHSFGAMMTNALGCYRGNVLRAIAPVAGGPPGRGNVTCAGEVAAWLAHGENDTTVNYMTSGIPARDFWLSRNGCTMTSEAATPAPCVAYQGCRDGLPVHWCVHQNAHDWPSFAGAGVWGFFAGFN